MPKRRSRSSTESHAGRVAAAIGRHPREFVGGLLATAAAGAIFANALFLQRGPHPAPIFAAARPLTVQERSIASPRPRPAEVAPAPPAQPVRTQTQVIGDIQRELLRKGYYDGPADGIWGARTDAAARDLVQAAGLRINAEPSESLLRAIALSAAKQPAPRAAAASPARNDPIAELIAPAKKVVAVQRALADFGYGQLKPTGTLDAETQSAIEKFERDRRLPVTGQVSEVVLRELAAMTGRPLE